MSNFTLISRQAINKESKLVRSQWTGEMVYQTPWSTDFLTDDCQISGDLKTYLNGCVKIRFMTSKEEEDKPKILGWVSGNNIVLRKGSDIVSTVVHEIQHCLQDQDGRTAGGNPIQYKGFVTMMTEFHPQEELRGISNQFLNTHLEKLVQEWIECKQWMKKAVKWEFMVKDFGSTLYRHLLGEIEARQAEDAIGEINEDLIHSAEEGITGLLKRKGWRTLAYYMNNKGMFEKHKQEAELKQKQYWDEENKKRMEKQEQLKLEQQLSPEYEMELLEEYYWNVLGDEYRTGMHKPRTNYKKKK